jgi:hypothetical protein
MFRMRLPYEKWSAFSALSIFMLVGTVGAPSIPAQNVPQDSQDNNSRSVQDRDAKRDEVARFDRFLDSHREIAEQLRKDPSLVDNKEFVKDHPALETWLQQNPGITQDLTKNPGVFMQRENRYDDSENRRELSNFDRFLDSHPETAQQLRRDPSLIDNTQYMKDHPELQTYLQDHPAVRQQIKDNPDAFMRAEDRYDRAEDSRSHDLDRNEDGARDRERSELASFTEFLDNHRETGEQLRRNPSLADNQQFLKDHPALQSYLQDHPAVREQLRQDPNAFMQREARYDRREEDINRDTAYNRDRGNDIDRDHDAHRHFGEFLGNHGDIAEQLAKDPSLVKKQHYLQDHPELRDYLNQHPEVRQPLMADPQNFVNKSTEQFNTNSQPVKSPGTAAPETSPAGAPKPNKQ